MGRVNIARKGRLQAAARFFFASAIITNGDKTDTMKAKKKNAGRFTGHDPTPGSYQKVLETPRVEWGSGQEMLEISRDGTGRVGSGRVGSEGFQTSRVQTGYPDST